MNNPYGLEKEKLEWLESIGAKAFDNPMIYSTRNVVGDSWYMLSHKYIQETPLDEMKVDYSRAKQKG